MTQEDWERDYKENATVIMPDEQERYRGVLKALSEMKAVADSTENKMMAHALYSVMIELDGLMSVWRCRMPKQEGDHDR